MSKATKVKTIPPSTLELTFSDRGKARVDVAGILHLAAFAPLADPEYFTQAEVDEIGGVYWPNGADLSPEFLEISIERNLGNS